MNKLRHILGTTTLIAVLFSAGVTTAHAGFLDALSSALNGLTVTSSRDTGASPSSGPVGGITRNELSSAASSNTTPQLVPGGTLKDLQIACAGSSTANCYATLSWSTAGSALKGAPISDVGIIDNATGQPAKTGSWVPGVNYIFDDAEGSMTFRLPVGSYTAYLWGWDAQETQVELDHKAITITGSERYVDPDSDTGSAAKPTGSLSVAGCTMYGPPAPPTCPVVVTWKDVQNSTSEGKPFVVMNVIDSSSNFFGGAAQEGKNYHADTVASGSFTFHLAPGTYAIPLYGWYQGAYSLIDSKVVTVSEAVPTLCQGTNTPSTGCVLPDTGTTPTATLTVNGGSSATVKAGQPIVYNWSSTNATSFSSTFTEDSPSCGFSGTGPFKWVADTSTGSVNSSAIECQGGHTYTITYVAKNAAGAEASASVTVSVTSNCQFTFNGACISGSPQAGSTNTPSNPTTQTGGTGSGPTGSLVTSGNCRTSSAGGTCAVSVSFTTQNSFNPPPYPSAAVSVRGDNGYYATYSSRAVAGQAYVGGRYIDNLPPNGYTFNLPKGTYTIELLGWNYYAMDPTTGTHSSPIASTTIVVSDPSTTAPAPAAPVRADSVTPTSSTVSNTAAPTSKPTGTFAATNCTATSGTCGVAVTWDSVQNSLYQGAPYVIINVIDAKTGAFFKGASVEGVSTHQAQTTNGSFTFQLPPGTYNIALYGWYNNTYSLIDLKQAVVGSTNGAAAITALLNFNRATPEAAPSATIKQKISITHILSRGMSGSDVNQLQLFLNEKGYLDAPVSGYFGPKTEEAVKKYQKDHNIEQTGVCGHNTINAIVGE